jgi:hypothetical protein
MIYRLYCIIPKLFSLKMRTRNDELPWRHYFTFTSLSTFPVVPVGPATVVVVT